MKRLIVFFLLIPFFLPFTAEGSNETLKIVDRYLSDISNDGTIAFRVKIEGYEGNLWGFGFDVIYDSDVLEYVGYTSSYVYPGHQFMDVARIDDNTLRVTTNGYHTIPIKYTSDHSIVTFTFFVKKNEETTLRLANLQGDFNDYKTEDGFLLMGGYSSQPQLPGLGYPGLPFSQGYPFLNPLVPINNPYLYPYPYPYPSTPALVASYVFPAVSSYQSSSYFLWQPNLYQQPSYSQYIWPSFFPYWGGNQL